MVFDSDNGSDVNASAKYFTFFLSVDTNYFTWLLIGITDCNISIYAAQIYTKSTRKQDFKPVSYTHLNRIYFTIVSFYWTY